MIITTTPTLEGHPIREYKGIVFGEVITGMDVVDKIQQVPTGRNDRPLKDVVIEKAEVVEN